MSEKEAIKKLNEILEEWQKILDIEDEVDREIEMSMYFEDMPFIEIQTVLQALKDKDNRIDELEKSLIDEDFKYKEKINQIKDRLEKDIKDFEYTQIGIRDVFDFRNSGRLLEAKILLDILEG